MKKCTHCGASIKGSAAAFCPKCKKPLKKSPKRKQPPKTAANPKEQRKPPQTKKAAPPPRPRKRTKKKLMLPKIGALWLFIKLKLRKKEHPEVAQKPVINPMDENYDGYYDDTPTDDNAQNKEGLDPELTKRIVLISGGALVVIVLAFVLMAVLA